MNTIKIIISILLFCILLTSCQKNEVIKSPDGTMYLSTDHSRENIVLEIFDSKNRNLLFSEDTKISNRHNWSIKWYSNSKIVIDSSDTGIYKWEKENSTWKKKVALYHLSPDGETSVYTWLKSRKDKQIILSVGKEKPNQEGFETKQKIETSIEVEDVVDCIVWENSVRFVLKAANGKTYAWKKNNSGTWEEDKE